MGPLGNNRMDWRNRLTGVQRMDLPICLVTIILFCWGDALVTTHVGHTFTFLPIQKDLFIQFYPRPPCHQVSNHVSSSPWTSSQTTLPQPIRTQFSVWPSLLPSRLWTRMRLIVTNPRRGFQTPAHSTVVLESAWNTTQLSARWSNALLSFIYTEMRQSKISSNNGHSSLMVSRSLQQPVDSNWLVHTPQYHSGRTLPLPPRSLKILKDWVCLRTTNVQA